MTNNQRNLVGFAAALVLLAGCTNGFQWPKATRASTTSATEQYKWKMALSWPKDFPIFYAAAAKFANNVATMSGGRLQIELATADVHKKAFGVLDMVGAGEYEMAHTASYYFIDKDPATVFFTTIPFGMTPVEQYSWFYYGGGIELMHKVYAKHNITAFPVGNTHTQMGGWFKKEIKSVDDLRGLRMRIPGHAGKVVKRVGVESVNLPGGEIYSAFEAGKIDAAEWVGPGHDSKLGLHKLASNYYVGWHEPATELVLFVNKQNYDALPSDLRTIIVVAAQATALDMLSHSFYANAVEWPNLLKASNIYIRSWPADVVDAFRRSNEELLRETAKGSADAKEVIDSQRAFYEKARDWTRITDKEYLQIR